LKAAVESAGVLGTLWRGMWFGEEGGDRFLERMNGAIAVPKRCKVF
jgi:hypothetical protein